MGVKNLRISTIMDNTNVAQIFVESNSNHLQQIYCGFEYLRRNGVLSLRQIIDKESSIFKKSRQLPTGVQSGYLKVIINEDHKIVYDVHDGDGIDMELLDWCDRYNKRSFSLSKHANLSPKIKPLGLNYLVSPDGFSALSFARSWALTSDVKSKLKNLLREVDVKHLYSYRPTTTDLHYRPKLSENPRVLFLCRLWDPSDDDHFSLTKKQAEDRLEINHNRIECIRKLKDVFRDSFVGGLAATPYAVKEFPEIVFSDQKMTSKRKYLSYLKTFDICVATTGLSNSIGWKLGEYIAMSKSIVTEPLHADLPGDIQANKNYLEFSDSESCVEVVGKLIEDKKFRLQMMVSNFEYYKNFLRPDKLVLNSVFDYLK